MLLLYEALGLARRARRQQERAVEESNAWGGARISSWAINVGRSQTPALTARRRHLHLLRHTWSTAAAQNLRSPASPAARLASSLLRPRSETVLVLPSHARERSSSYSTAATLPRWVVFLPTVSLDLGSSRSGGVEGSFHEEERKGRRTLSLLHNAALRRRRCHSHSGPPIVGRARATSPAGPRLGHYFRFP